MKKIYMTLAIIAAFTTTSIGQISACMKGDTVSISFDDSQNCAAAPGDLAGMATIGFHSGADSWASVVDWDNANANVATNNGSDVFTVDVEPLSYYGLAAMPTGISFVFNQGPTDPAAPWASEGKGDDPNGGACVDFAIVLADLAACATSTEEIVFEGDVTIAPNPMVDRTSIRFSNPNNENFNMTITSMMGQIVRTQTNISTDAVTIERGDLTAGVYFVTLQNEAGAKTTQKLIVQ